MDFKFVVTDIILFIISLKNMNLVDLFRRAHSFTIYYNIWY